ncbi:MAG: xanthine dehydrogenase family protein molybdopterin-binding subunit [Acidimicrobiales bacterium]
MSGSILGTRVKRIEDPKMLTEGGSYINDLRLEGALYVTYVRSTMAHARLRSIDVEDARSADGVVAVYTFPDLGLPPSPPMMAFMNQAMLRPMLAHETVRFVGEPIVAILAETRQAGADAAELVMVDYDPLPVVVDPEVACNDEMLLFPEVGTNIVCEIPLSGPDDLFAECEVIVEVRIISNRLAPAPMEPRVAAAVWDGTRLTQWAAGQGVFGAQGGIARLNGLDISQVRIITPDVGGSFGAKGGTSPEELLVGWLSCKHERPVRWFETRTENMTAMAHGRAQVQYAKLGGTRDGRFLAYSLKVIQESGGYPSLGALLPNFTKLMASGTYAIEKVATEAVTVLTNTTPVGAYRGAGRPEATAALERVVDMYAAEIGMDPGDLRRRNVIAPSAFPYTTPTGAAYDSGEYADAIDRVQAAAGYTELRAEQQARRRAGDRKLLGIGLASYVEVTNPMGSGEWASFEVKNDGGAIVRSGVSSHGQGLGTAFVMLASERTGIPIERMEYHQSDTDEIPRGGGTGGSRSLQVGGSAVAGATDLVVETARKLAADQLEANVDDVVLDLDNGNFHVVGTPAKAVGWAEIASAQDAPLVEEFDFKPGGATFPFGAHVAVVEVDRDTGHVTVQRLVAVDDCGVIVNPLLADGQVHGGLAQGIAQALIEEVRYDELGNPLTSNFADYGIISAAELPSFERHPMQTPTPRNPLGAKGIGESGTIGSTPAVQNAVVDALSHLGVRHLDMPFTAERVWRAIISNS